jgi:uncharacterized protein (TIGR03437 family)
MRPLLLSIAFLATLVAFAQQPGPALTVDANAGQHAISPDIYGLNPPVGGTYQLETADFRATARRWGGNESDRYDYRTDYKAKTSDWYFEDLEDPSTPGLQLPEGSSFNQYADQARTTNGKILATANVLGWLPKAQHVCSYSVAKYGKQCSTDQYWPDCGDGQLPGTGSSCGSAILTNDPTDANFQVDQTYQQGWIGYLLSRYGQGNQGGAAIWDLANEPIWWDDTNQDIHPNPYTYDELLSLDMASAIAIKQADPTALVSGPVADNYASIWFSKKDIVAGWNATGNWWGNPVDQNAHGGVPIMTWYLQQFQNYETKNNVRLLDYYDTHAYLAPGSDPASLLDSTREWWDPTYILSGNYWICDPTNNGAPTAPQLIPRLKGIINTNYPGTKLAITEYSFGSLDTIAGALAQADILGIFGREGVDLATIWGPPQPTDPGAFAWKIYTNYDGIGGAFGETGVQATSADQGQLSVYAALRSDLNLTVVVINKTANNLSTTLALSNFNAGASAQVWLYSGSNLSGIVAQPNVAISGNSISTTFPSYSMTMLAIPPASYPVAKPVVTALQNAASYATTFAPGQMVVVYGQSLGPATLVSLNGLPASQRVDSNGLVVTNLGGVRILFDGIPAPMVYASQTQCSAVIPYFGAYQSTSHVQVEYQGVRSDPFAITISPTAPGFFTTNMSGSGQGIIQVDAQGTVNSAAHPAHPGSTVVLWLTGEGITNPPGVDGRPAVQVLPKPVAAVTVTIGGLPATIQYAGAVPTLMPGLMQINAVLDPGVQAGNAVPVVVQIGNNSTQSNVTMVVD